MSISFFPLQQEFGYGDGLRLLSSSLLKPAFTAAAACKLLVILNLGLSLWPLKLDPGLPRPLPKFGLLFSWLAILIVLWNGMMPLSAWDCEVVVCALVGWRGVVGCVPVVDGVPVVVFNAEAAESWREFRTGGDIVVGILYVYEI